MSQPHSYKRKALLHFHFQFRRRPSVTIYPADEKNYLAVFTLLVV